MKDRLELSVACGKRLMSEARKFSSNCLQRIWTFLLIYIITGVQYMNAFLKHAKVTCRGEEESWIVYTYCYATHTSLIIYKPSSCNILLYQCFRSWYGIIRWSWNISRLRNILHGLYRCEATGERRCVQSRWDEKYRLNLNVLTLERIWQDSYEFIKAPNQSLHFSLVGC